MDFGHLTGAQGRRPDRPNLVFIHGSGGSARSYLGLLSPLGRSFNTLALDLPGHGATPPPASDTVRGHVTWLKPVLDELQVKPFILIGHSLGGAIAQAYALTFPEDPAGLVLMATGARLRVAPQILEGLQRDFEATVSLIIKWCFFNQDETITTISQELMLATGPQVLLADFTACDRFDVTAEVAHIVQPTLVLTGEEDKMTPPKYARFLAQKIPQARLTLIPEAGHMVFVEKLKTTTLSIAAFAAEVFG